MRKKASWQMSRASLSSRTIPTATLNARCWYLCTSFSKAAWAAAWLASRLPSQLPSRLPFGEPFCAMVMRTRSSSASTRRWFLLDEIPARVFTLFAFWRICAVCGVFGAELFVFSGCAEFWSLAIRMQSRWQSGPDITDHVEDHLTVATQNQTIVPAEP